MISRGSMRVAAHITKSLVAREMHNPNPTIFDDAIRYLVPHVANRQKLSFEDAVSGVEEVARASMTTATVRRKWHCRMRSNC